MIFYLKSRATPAKKIFPKQERSDQVREEMLQSIQNRLSERRAASEKLADALVWSAGTITFVAFHIVLFTAWIYINLGFVSGIGIFDPYPFNFLTMTVSLEAIFLAIFVLMSQNRESKTADLRQEFDVQVNIIAEREITKIIHMLAYTMNYLNVPYEKDAELRQMMRPLNIDEIREELEHQIGTAKNRK
ncbi:MAG: DUF1003 domain-containing protein [Candidatus Sungbacteria bacterium]|nr:DUF1003 domain-containing protein [bacterium]MDZ4260077.1 DUF1003 domain-containing protein [Candidatus Sungbacteria bacterium]